MMQNEELQLNQTAQDPLSTKDVLKARRVFLHLTQQQVASAAGISVPQYQKFEGGFRNLKTASFLVACQVLEALQLDISDFFHCTCHTDQMPDSPFTPQAVAYSAPLTPVKVTSTKKQIRIVIQLP